MSEEQIIKEEMNKGDKILAAQAAMDQIKSLYGEG
ncbi:MAG: hypothetical protein UT42_C0012G0001, partial [Candidatus Falkowbacteria bacterium GW2011_GWA2_39_24]